MTTKERLPREVMAMRIARELKDGYYVNLGIGIPTLVSNYVPPEMTVIIHSENGILGVGPLAEQGQEDFDLINAGGQHVTLIPGGCFFHHADSFAMVRGGHIDVTVLGGLQVSERGDLANWMIPTRGVGSIGGAADLVYGAKKLIVVMEHTAKDGQPKLVTTCSFPLTGRECVKMVVTDVAVIDVTKEGLVLREVAPGWTPGEVQAITEPKLIVPRGVKEIEL